MICGAPFSQNGFTFISARLAVLRKNVLAVPIVPYIFCVISLTENKIIYACAVDHKFTNHLQKLFIYAFNRKGVSFVVLIIQLLLSDLSGQFVHFCITFVYKLICFMLFGVGNCNNPFRFIFLFLGGQFVHICVTARLNA